MVSSKIIIEIDGNKIELNRSKAMLLLEVLKTELGEYSRPAQMVGRPYYLGPPTCATGRVIKL